MEILFLNTLNGEIRRPISEFIARYAGRTDIFCLQEAYAKKHNMRQLCRELLPQYCPVFAYKEIQGDDFAQATYTHPGLSVLHTEVLLPTEQDFGLGIISEVEHSGKRLSVCNFHGRSKPGHKLDTPERLEQSRRVIDYFHQETGQK